MLRRTEPRKSSSLLYSSIGDNQENKVISNKRTTAGCFGSSTGGSVTKLLQYLVCHEGGLGVSLKAVLLLLHVVVPAMTLRPHSLRLEVNAIQQQLHLLYAPM
jgi:hypothetical protein